MKVAFYLGNGFISKSIEFFTRSPYSHVAILWEDGSVFEAWPIKGVVHSKSLGSLHKKTEIDIFEVKTTPEQDQVILKFLNDQLGKGYDYLGFLGFVFNWTGERKKWFCSELVFEAFKIAGIFLLERLKAFKVYPALLSYSNKMKFLERIKT